MQKHHIHMWAMIISMQEAQINALMFTAQSSINRITYGYIYINYSPWALWYKMKINESGSLA